MSDPVADSDVASERWRSFATTGTAVCGVVVGVVQVLIFTSCFDGCPSSPLVVLLWANLAVMGASVFLSAFAERQRALIWLMGATQVVTVIALYSAAGADFARENWFAIVPMLFCQTLAPLAWGQRRLSFVAAVVSIATIVILQTAP